MYFRTLHWLIHFIQLFDTLFFQIFRSTTLIRLWFSQTPALKECEKIGGTAKTLAKKALDDLWQAYKQKKNTRSVVKDMCLGHYKVLG